MKFERVLSLDISSKTGWASATISDYGIKLEDYGTILQTHSPDGEYPSNYVIWAHTIFDGISSLIKLYKPDVLIIEETSKGSKNAMSQKILEWTHFLLAKHIKDNNIKSVYIMTEAWRREIGCKMSDKEKLKNKEVRTYKKKNKSKLAYDINGKRIGIVGRKHINVRRANEIFGDQLREPLRKKDEDTADSLGLLASYYFRQLKNENKEEMNFEDLIKDKV